VNLYALALVINALIGWPIWLSVVISAAFVLAYITLGGLSGAIYNEVLQFFVIIAGWSRWSSSDCTASAATAV
jgi:SSS family solute:Na+ symporter